LKANVTRWFDNIQNLEEFSHNRILPIVHINQNATTLSDKPEKAPAEKKQKVENTKSEKKDEPKDPQPIKKEIEVESDNKKQDQQQQKPKKEQQQNEKKPQQPKQQQQQKGGGKGGAKQDNSDQPDIAHLDIRVGKIIQVEKHPNADSLYVEQIDLGESAPRTIVSGLVNFVPIEEMKDRLVVVLCNLKPRATRGVTSAGMVLCASLGAHDAKPEDRKVEPLNPPKDCQPGTQIFFEGFTGFKPDDELNPKKKHLEKVLPDWTTTGDLVAVYKDKPFMTPSGPCTVKSIVGGTIS